MRIGIVTAEYPPAIGGVGDHCARLAAELARLGHTVEVLTSKAAGDDGGRRHAWPHDEHAAGPAHRVETSPARLLPLVKRWDWRILFTVPRLALEREWDVVHIHYQPAAYGLHPAINLLTSRLRRLRLPAAIVTTFHDLRTPYLFPKAGRLRTLAVREMARGSEGIIAVANEDLAQLVPWTHAPRRRTAVEHIPLGNHFDAPLPAGFDRVAWRASLGLQTQAALIGHVGFVNRSKAIDELVRAVAMLVRAGRDVHMLLIGDELGSSDATNTRYFETVRRLVEELGIEARVHWTGYQPVDAAGAWLRCADVAVLPFRDGASLRRTSLIACWAHGVPVVTTEPAGSGAPWPGAPLPAVTLPAPRAEAIAVALAELLGDSEWRAQLTAGGLAFAERFSWPVVAQKTAALYRAARAIPR
ncbi:MAG: glycosyltransferase family 4 protein [Chloroflexi bacterium]|nr:glycosyltransferase family 4 protein [Chloroflexota bacterium]